MRMLPIFRMSAGEERTSSRSSFSVSAIFFSLTSFWVLYSARSASAVEILDPSSVRMSGLGAAK